MKDDNTKNDKPQNDNRPTPLHERIGDSTLKGNLKDKREDNTPDLDEIATGGQAGNSPTSNKLDEDYKEES